MYHDVPLDGRNKFSSRALKIIICAPNPHELKSVVFNLHNMSETLKCVSNEINKSSNSSDNTGMAFEMKMGFQYNI